MELASATEKYRDYIEASLTPGTARAYMPGVRHLLRYLEECYPDVTEVEQLTPVMGMGYVEYIYRYLLERAGGRSEKIRESTKQLYMMSAGSFFEWLVIQTERVTWTLAEYEKLKKAYLKAAKTKNRGQLPPERLPTDEIIALLLAEVERPVNLEGLSPGEAKRQELAWLRNIAMIRTMQSSGIRVGELVHLERGHLLFEEHALIIKNGKGGKDRKVLLTPEAWAAIQLYLSARKDRGKNVLTLPLFSRHDRGAGGKIVALTTRTVQNVLEQLSVSSGIYRRFHLTPHTLRHWFATEFLSRTGNLALTQFALGHASPTTTRIYAQDKWEDYKDAYEEAFGQ